MGDRRGAGVTVVLVDPGSLRPGASVPLSASEGHHLRVRRVDARRPEPVVALDGAGCVGRGTLVAEGDVWRFLCEASTTYPRPTAIRLAVGAGDRERFGWMVEKCAELGVSDVVPLETERVRSVASRVRPAQVASLSRKAREAIKQSGNPWAPVVHPVTALEALLADGEPGQALLVADPMGDRLDPSALAPTTVVIGPEGGLTDGERDRCLSAGARRVRVAPFVLRFETAAVVAAALLLERSRPDV